MRASTFPTDDQLSIGAVSRATGIPTETLRTWETRYGFPVPQRRPSGHRAYPVSIVPRLQRMAEALARGHRAAQVVGASDTELADLLGLGPGPGTSAAGPDPDAASRPVEILDAVALFDGVRLTRTLHADWARLGLLDFLERRVAPLLEAMGNGWRSGRFDVRHEHFLTERLSDLLRSVRLPYDDRSRGPVIVLATLTGETHGLGLLMAALVIAAAGGRAANLGVDVPVREIARAARELHGRAVGISISPSCAGAASARQLTQLRSLLPRRMALLLGGAGAPMSRRAGIQRVSDLRALDGWVRETVAGGQGIGR